MLHKTILVLTKKSMFYVLMFEFMLLGVIGGLLGIFYPLCSKVFVPMVKSGNRFLHFIAYPLGFCIYCSIFWITMLILILFLTGRDSLPKWQDIVIGTIAAGGVTHLIVYISCRFLIHKHPDLDKDYLKHLHE